MDAVTRSAHRELVDGAAQPRDALADPIRRGRGEAQPQRIAEPTGRRKRRAGDERDSFGKGGLTGAPISSTAGHLVVISGFTRAGKVVVNDPAAPNNSSVRRVYDRGQFERAWQTKSHGTVYVVRDTAHHELMTLYQDYDWADELIHTYYGNRWLKYFLEKENNLRIQVATISRQLILYQVEQNELQVLQTIFCLHLNCLQEASLHFLNYRPQA